MLWTKSWIETRWQFLIGLALTVASAVATVLVYPQVLEVLPTLNPSGAGPLARRIQEELALAQDYRGYISSQWFADNLRQLSVLFALLLGVAAPLSASRGALFTLSLPVSRSQLLGVHGITGLAQLLILTLVPSMLIPLLSPSIGQSYSVAAALGHGLLAFAGAAVFFVLGLLLSTQFDDVWRPLLIGIAISFVVKILGAFDALHNAAWIGVIACVALSVAMYEAARVSLARRDF